MQPTPHMSVAWPSLDRKKSSVHDLGDLKNLHILSDAQDSFGTRMIFEGQLERTGLDAVAFLSRTTFNSYIAPTPLERLEAGEGDAAVVARCELEKLAQQGFPAEHFRVVGDLQNLTNAVPGPGCFIRDHLRHCGTCEWGDGQGGEHRCAVDARLVVREMVAGHGFWSGQGFVQDAQARTICSSSGQSDDGLLDEVEGGGSAL